MALCLYKKAPQPCTAPRARITHAATPRKTTPSLRGGGSSRPPAFRWARRDAMDGGDPPRKPHGNRYPRRGDIKRKIIKDLTGGGGGGGGDSGSWGGGGGGGGGGDAGGGSAAGGGGGYGAD
ncbi:hypothetical protein GQ55_9G516000 [Panicum hallii var. hallii]|uniref:Uncharacterized protein n=1 Tax=Panicum hallii var. hallii TaxID=1504633 RepID=A0A2T7CE09_9POAL|nr:hypothetical protein GQ55_9G516000 [Panicum hallii var. hallii]